MAELATIARPYAEALFQSAKNDLAGTSGWLDALAAVAGDAQLLQFAGNPKVDAKQVEDLVVEVAKVKLSDAVVYSAFPIAAGSLGEVAQTLEKRFGRKLNVTVQEDPSLIGGIRVVVGDEVLDTSVKARLEQMKVALTA